jgi:NADPH-dependent glutamate synthase beta subunit-like oxidoreductase
MTNNLRHQRSTFSFAENSTCGANSRLSWAGFNGRPAVTIGTRPNPLLAKTTPGLKTHSWGGLLVDERQVETSVHRVHAGGDAGAATVILAAGAGKRAAEAIHHDLSADEAQPA